MTIEKELELSEDSLDASRELFRCSKCSNLKRVVIDGPSSCPTIHKIIEHEDLEELHACSFFEKLK